MQRAAIMFGLAMMLVFAAAGAVLAAQLACNKDPCIGTDNDDLMYERAGDNKKDSIFGLKGDDVIDANTFFSDRDALHGQEGRDRLLSNDGDGRDVVKGGPGRDTCIYDRGDRPESCEIKRKATFQKGTSSVQGDLPAAAFE